MLQHTRRFASRRPFATAATLASLALLTGAAAWLWAHEGHEALPTRGVETVKDGAGVVAGVNLGPEALRALDVQVADVVPVTLDDRLAAPATVVAPWDRHAFVTSPLGGKVVALNVRPGDPVAADKVVAEVESLELVDLQRELIDARSEADLSAKNLAELKEGNRRGSVPEKVFREAEAQHEQNRDALDVARRKLLGLGVPPDVVESLGRDAGARPLRTLPVRAPFAGVASHVDVGVGQVIEPGDHLLEVSDLSRVWVRVAVLEKDLHRVREGHAVELRFPAARAEPWDAAVTVKGRSLDAPASWGTAWADVDNPGGRLLPGMAGQARVRLPAARAGLLVPAGALVREGAECYVLVEVAPGQYRRQNVVVEAERGDRVQVGRDTGLFPGDRVVTAGSHELASFFGQGTLRVSPEAGRGIGLDVRPVTRRSVAEVVTFTAVSDLPPSARAVASSRLPGTLRRLAVGRDQAVGAGGGWPSGATRRSRPAPYSPRSSAPNC